MADPDLAVVLIGLSREVEAIRGTVSRHLGLTPQQAQVLCAVEHRSPSLGELANLLGCEKTNVTGLVDRIERRGLLRRDVVATDRRVARVTLTPEGSALVARLHDEMSSALARRLGAVPVAYHDQLRDLAGTVAETLRRAR